MMYSKLQSTIQCIATVILDAVGSQRLLIPTDSIGKEN